jgi:hypothetical protein
MGYNSVVKNEIRSFIGKWMEPKVIMLSETNYTQRQILPVFSQMQKGKLKRKTSLNGGLQEGERTSRK